MQVEDRLQRLERLARLQTLLIGGLGVALVGLGLWGRTAPGGASDEPLVLLEDGGAATRLSPHALTLTDGTGKTLRLQPGMISVEGENGVTSVLPTSLLLRSTTDDRVEIQLGLDGGGGHVSTTEGMGRIPDRIVPWGELGEESGGQPASDTQ